MIRIFKKAFSSISKKETMKVVESKLKESLTPVFLNVDISNQVMDEKLETENYLKV
jgi:hypothetical protein